MKKTIMIAVLGAFVFLVVEVVVGTLFMRNQGFSARDEPSFVEKFLARNARNIATPSEAKTLQNPEPVNDETMAEAREHFVEHCSICHGIDGRGDTMFGKNMYPKVPSLADAQTQQLRDGELFYIINNGVRLTGMPAFGGEDSPESVWHLVSFIRRLPQLSPDELKQLRELAGEETIQEAADEGARHAEEGKEHTMPEKRVQPAEKNSNQAAGERDTKPKRKMPKSHPHGPGTKPHKP